MGYSEEGSQISSSTASVVGFQIIEIQWIAILLNQNEVKLQTRSWKKHCIKDFSEGANKAHNMHAECRSIYLLTAGFWWVQYKPSILMYSEAIYCVCVILYQFDTKYQCTALKEPIRIMFRLITRIIMSTRLSQYEYQIWSMLTNRTKVQRSNALQCVG